MSKMKKYPWYVVCKGFIISCWDFKEDAKEFVIDLKSEAREDPDYSPLLSCKVMSYNSVVKLGLNPASQKSMKNPDDVYFTVKYDS